MLRAILQQNMVFYAMAAIGILGVISQLFLNGIYERLMRDAENNGAPKGKFMKRLRHQFGASKRLNEGLTNISVFVKKSIYEYRCVGLSLHQWRRFGGTTLILCLGLAAAGYLLSGAQGFAANITQNYLWAGGAVLLLLLGTQAVIDVGYKNKYLQIQLEDYLCNSGIGNEYQEVDIKEKQQSHKEVPERETMSDKRTEAKSVVISGELHGNISGNMRGPMIESGLSTKSGWDERDLEEAKTAVTLGAKKRQLRPMESKAQKDKRELKQNLARLKEGLNETAAEREHSKERNTEILKQMDPIEQERIIREVLKEFLS